VSDPFVRAIPRGLAVAALVAAAIFGAPRPARADGACLRAPGDEAAIRLRAEAMSAPDPVAGLEATKSYLRALNDLGTTAKRIACFDDMESDVPKLRERYCQDGSTQRESEGCALLARIHADILRLRAQKVVEAADMKSPAERDSAQPLYEKAGHLYLAIFHDFCEAPVAAGRGPVEGGGASHCAEVGYNAARAFSAVHQAGNAAAAYRGLIDFDHNLKGDSGARPLATKALYEIGAQYQSMALYEQAAESYERFVTVDVRSPQASRALGDAVILRLGLGQHAKALEDALLFTKNWGSTKRAEVASITLAIALDHAERGEKDKALSVLKTNMEMLDRGPIDLTVRAHGLLARLAPTPALAHAENLKVRDLWRDPRAAEAMIRAGWPSEDQWQHDRRLARSVTAVGEAMFALTEERRVAEVTSLVLPSYAGPRDTASVLAFIETKVKPWYVKKLAAIEKLEPEYVKILMLEPVPPPTWVIASAAAVGAIWGDFADDFRRVPIPEAWKKDRPVLRAYTEAVAEMSESTRQRRAKPAMRKCVDLSVKYQMADSRSDGCTRWLEANYRAEYRLVDEIRPAATRSSGAFAMPPLAYEGQLHR